MIRRRSHQQARRPGQIHRGLLPTWMASWQARRALQQLDLPAALAHTGALLVSELVTNSVRHTRLAAGELIRLSLNWSDTRLRASMSTTAAVPATAAAAAPAAAATSTRTGLRRQVASRHGQAGLAPCGHGRWPPFQARAHHDAWCTAGPERGER